MKFGRRALAISLAIIFSTVLAIVAFTTRDAAAQTGNTRPTGAHYRASEKAWDGLSTLAAIAAGQGLQVVEPGNLEWDQLDNEDIVLLVYPTVYLDPTKIVSFIRNGGRVLIADDFGTADEFFAKLGARRTDRFRGSSVSGTHVSGTHFSGPQLYAPIALPVGTHPLSKDVKELITNHPSVFSDLGAMRSVFELAPGESVVAAGHLGLGRYVALSDPSVLINRMLQFEGNFQFSINLLAYLSRAGKSSRLVLFSAEDRLSGVPSNRFDDGSWQSQVSAALTDVDGWLEDLSEWLLTARSLRALAIAASIVLAIFVVWASPRPRHQAINGDWLHAGDRPQRTKSGSLSSRHLVAPGHGRGATSYLLPAAIARDNVIATLEQATGEHDPLGRFSDKHLVSLLRDNKREDAAIALAPLLPLLRALPERAQVSSQWKSPFLGLREFERLYSMIQTFHGAIPLPLTTKEHV